MTGTTGTQAGPHVIVVGTDFSEVSNLALQQAWLLATERGDAQLHIVHVADDRSGWSSRGDAMQAQDRVLEELPAKLRNYAVRQAQASDLPPLNLPMGVHVRLGKPAEQILQLAADLDAAMVVVGSHGRRGLNRLMLGSVSEKLVRAGRLPILVSRPKHLEDMAHREALEPPCPDCVAVRHQSGGQRWWCDVHGRPHVGTHVYSSTQRVDYSKAPMDFEGALLQR